MIALACQCGKQLHVPDNAAGKAAKCPKCGQVVRAPQLRPTVGSAGSVASAPPVATVDPHATRSSAASAVSGETVGGLSRTAGDPLTAFRVPAEKSDELGRLGGFRILKILGHGGMGVVYLVEDPQAPPRGRHQGDAPQPRREQRFLREAQAAAGLAHDHIVSILRVGEDRGVPFIVMPFLKGESLDNRLERGNEATFFLFYPGNVLCKSDVDLH